MHKEPLKCSNIHELYRNIRYRSVFHDHNAPLSPLHVSINKLEAVYRSEKGEKILCDTLKVLSKEKCKAETLIGLFI